MVHAFLDCRKLVFQAFSHGMMTPSSISLAFLQRLALSCHQIFFGFRGEVFCLVMARFRSPRAFSQGRQRYWKRHEAFQWKFQTTGLFKKQNHPNEPPVLSCMHWGRIQKDRFSVVLKTVLRTSRKISQAEYVHCFRLSIPKYFYTP